MCKWAYAYCMARPPTPSSSSHPARHWLRGGFAAAIAALLAACGVSPSAPSGSARPSGAAPGSTSAARSAVAYRQDAAKHLYALNAQRIFPGKLQPLLYAVGTLEVNVGRKGEVRSLHWMRAPRHAPEVMREIERTVRAAAPFPVPARIGYVTYTDTWLWDKSGRFQLHTLSEGQLDESR